MAKINILDLEVRLGVVSKDLRDGVKRSEGDLKSLRKSFADTAKAIGNSAAANSSKNIQEVRAQITRTIKEIDRLTAAGNKNLSEVTPLRRANILGGAVAVSKRLDKGLNQNSAGINKEDIIATREMDQALSANAKSMEKFFYQFERGGVVVKDFSAHAISLRYALYDIASVAGRVGQTITSMAQTVLDAGFAQESSFTQVQKTLVGKNASEIENLQTQLVDLTRQIPLTFDEVSKIAMLGSQLNVAPKELASFTATVAKFSAITGMSAEDAAMGFGKIANVLGILNKDGTISGEAMARLGSAIAAVGINSAATEQQIISTAKQIGSVATAAGVAASDVIALSGAFASIGIAPEEARGVTVQLFNEINKAANSLIPSLNKGSDRLRIFAEVAGMSQSEFAKLWQDKSGQNYFRTVGEGADATQIKMNGATKAFEDFVLGLGKGYDVQDVLKKIGLDGVRTSKGITGLAKGFSVLAAQIKIARDAGKSGTFLSDSFGVIADDINTKLKTLNNSLQALYATIGNNDVVKGSFGAILDVVQKLITGFDRFLKATGLSQIAGVVVILSSLIGVVLAVGSALLLAGGSFLAIRTAMANAAAAGVGFDGVIGRLITRMVGLTSAQLTQIATLQAQRDAMLGVTMATDIMDKSMQRAAVSARVMRIAMATTGLLAFIALAGTLYELMANGAEDTKDATKGLDDFQQGLINTTKEASRLSSELGELWDATNAITSNARKLKTSLAQAGEAASSGAWKKGGQDARDYETALDDVVTSAKNLFGDSEEELKSFLVSYSNFLKINGLATASYLAGLQSYIDALKGPGTGGNYGQYLIAFFDKSAKSASSATKEVKTLLEIVQQALTGINNLSSVYGSLRTLGGAINGIGKNFSSLNEKGSSALDALNTSIEQIVTNASENPQKAANQLGALRKAMFQVGITSRSAYVMIDKAISATGKKAKVSAKDVNTYFKQLSTGLTTEINSNARTIEDWANDIATVIGNALDIRFRGTTAQDAITSAWRNMAEAAAGADEEIRNIKDSLDSLNADKDVLTYQLGIAIKYGDTIRANKIKAELGKVDTEITKSTSDLGKAQDKQNKSLTDNSTAAIGNRAAVLELVQKYQSFLVTTAKTTTSQEELQKKAQEMRDDFIKQAKALGFAESELTQYADAISGDFVTAVKEIPTDITLKLTGEDAVIAALKQFAAKANIQLNSIKTTITPKIGNMADTGAKAGTKFTGNPGGGSPTPSGGSPTPTNNPGAKLPGGALLPEPVVDNTASALASSFSSYFATFAARYKGSGDVNGSGQTNGVWVFDPGMLVHSMSASDVAKSRLGKPKPSAAVLDLYQQGKAAIMAELNLHAKRNGLEQAWFGPAHNAALGEIYRKFKMGSFENAYGRGYASGGLISGPGTGTSDSIAARLSNGEFVMRASAVRTYGADFMNALNQMQVARPSYSATAAVAQSGSTMVYLSSEDRALLRAAIDRPINLYTDNAKIAQSANEGNVILARRGTK